MTQPPRRLDVDEDEANGILQRRPIVVFVDGERQARVLAYDIDEGFVRKVAKDRNGALLVEGDEILTELVSGRVQVAWHNEEACSCRA